jgi:hypothetical protein
MRWTLQIIVFLLPFQLLSQNYNGDYYHLKSKTGHVIDSIALVDWPDLVIDTIGFFGEIDKTQNFSDGITFSFDEGPFHSAIYTYNGGHMKRVSSSYGHKKITYRNMSRGKYMILASNGTKGFRQFVTVSSFIINLHEKYFYDLRIK